MNLGMLVMACLLAANPTGGDTYFINQQQIRIPISVEPARRAEIKEIHLFVSADGGKSWDQQAVASPDQDAFSFFAPKDGVYWFSVAVVNHQNQREPRDPYGAPPSQKIVIDTVKPLLRIRTAERQGDDVVVVWEVQEEFPDWATLRLEYRPAGAAANQWTPVQITGTPNGQTRFRPAVAGPLSVRMQIQDMAGSFATAETEVQGGVSSGMQLTSAPPATMPPNTTATSMSGANSVVLPTINPDQQSLTPTAKSDVRPPTEAVPFTPGGPLPAASNAGSTSPKLVATSDPNGNVVSPAAGTAPSRQPRGPMPNMTITNNRHLTLDYEVTKVGPSGIGRVELWVTRDDGRNWEKLGENLELKPPLKVDLVAEGQYGFRLVLQSRAGRSQPAPTPGTVPELRLELDTTAPTAQLYRPEPDPKQADALILSWNATDKNLAPNPITLQWCEKLGQDWQTIVADYPNEGRYAWKLPPNVPFLVYLRLIAHDTAGNVSMAETPEPVCIDLKEPEGRLIGVGSGVNRSPGADAARQPTGTPNMTLPVSFDKK